MNDLGMDYFGMFAGFYVVCIILGIIGIIGLWKIFEKASKPGWAAIIPVYNIVVILEIIGRPLWWVLLMFIPFINVVVSVIMYMDLAKSFGKSAGFGIGLAFLHFIFAPILGFGSARYKGPAATMPPTDYTN
jgi:hypothetical protein